MDPVASVVNVAAVRPAAPSPKSRSRPSGSVVPPPSRRQPPSSRRKSSTGTPLAGQPVRGLKLPADSALVVVLRGGRVIVPQADDALEPGDELLFVATAAVEDEIHAALGF